MNIILHGKHAHGRVAIIDDADAPLVAGLRWRLNAQGYVVADSGRARLHRLLLGLTDPKVQGDHRDRDKLNNRRMNLRACTNGQNQANRKVNDTNKAGLKGVSPHRARWQAQIKIDGRKCYLGLFDTPELAHAAYQKAAKELHGEFARFG